MKTKVYLRVASSNGKGKVAVRASSKPDYSPIEGVKMWKKSHGTFYPTVAFAIELDIPDEAFKKAEQVVARLNLENEQVKVNEIKVIKGEI